jgi:uncharacterized cupredoxin-like copper-binding protein
MLSYRITGVVAAMAVLIAACGDDGPDTAGVGTAARAGTSESPRTIDIAMVDIAFEPTAVTVQAGETVRFLFTNEGAVRHEATFGDEAEQEEHGALMGEAGGMEGMDMDGADPDDMDDTDESGAGHDDSESGDDGSGDGGHGDEAPPLVLEPGETGEVIMSFDAPDGSSTIIGCHEPGHWEAGMRVDVTVATA